LKIDKLRARSNTIFLILAVNAGWDKGIHDRRSFG
jgi:hypothetical protein